MKWRLLATAALACYFAALSGQLAAQEATAPSIRYLPLDAPPGMSQAVIVEGLPLVYTRQFLPLDAEGKIDGEGSADQQIERVLINLRPR